MIMSKVTTASTNLQLVSSLSALRLMRALVSGKASAGRPGKIIAINTSFATSACSVESAALGFLVRTIVQR
ncbi:hypothetical protein M752DRAFT_62289 [Aspergillus phoenicis ATCC 13157]|uniref:Uncharacterized protein n=1 Tax=Aspergillus phoenicis ATCC 13157 TaxID=1353007 RepID=A0A370PBF3_ASPPH|nr:hypothetical protein M752DRAFT_62289 [Aspergillus phoenicis ATCC 13157]